MTLIYRDQITKFHIKVVACRLDCEQSLFCVKICKGEYLSSEVVQVARGRVVRARIKAKRETAMVSYSILDVWHSGD